MSIWAVANSKPGIYLGEERELCNPENADLCLFPRLIAKEQWRLLEKAYAGLNAIDGARKAVAPWESTSQPKIFAAQ